MLDIILFILVLGINILIHEYAHFYFAKKADILCHEFSIGMGPALYQKRKGETLYAIRAIPLGGYVAMAGEDLQDYIKNGQSIGIVVDENEVINKMILNNESSYDHIGTVVDYDLYGAEGSELFITMNISGVEKRFTVSRTAHFVLSPKKEIQVGPSERSYENKTKWQRFKVVFAGPASNFILAFLILFFVALFMGKPISEPIIGKVDKNNAYLQTLIKENDEIKTINGKDVNSYDDISRIIYENKDNHIIVTLNESNSEIEIPLTIVFQSLSFWNDYNNDELIININPKRNSTPLEQSDKILGIYFSDQEGLTNLDSQYNVVQTWNELINIVESPDNQEKTIVYLRVLRAGTIEEISYRNFKATTLDKLGSTQVIYQIGIEQKTKFNLLYPLYFPFMQIGQDMKSMFNTLGLLFSRGTGVGVKDLAGPIGIFSLVSQAKENGPAVFFIFVAFLSVNIGFLNLLPIPALDGGRLVFVAYEAITKKKVNKKVENTLILITFILLLGLMIFVTYQDILRLFR